MLIGFHFTTRAREAMKQPIVFGPVSPCVCVYTTIENYWLCIDVTWEEYVPLDVIRFLVTFDRDIWPSKLFSILHLSFVAAVDSSAHGLYSPRKTRLILVLFLFFFRQFLPCEQPSRSCES